MRVSASKSGGIHTEINGGYIKLQADLNKAGASAKRF